MGSAPARKDQLLLRQSDLQVLRTLEKHGVRALVIGGRAMQFYVQGRESNDLDLLVSAPSGESVVAALRELGCSTSRPASDFVLPRKKIPIDYYDVELLTSVDGFKFEQVWANAVIAPLVDLSARVLSRTDLLRMKQASDRPQDQADVALLLGPLKEE